MPDTSKMERVAPGIWKNPANGRYTVLYRVVGSRRQHSATFDRLKEAKAFKAERDGDRAAGRRPPSASRQTVREFYDGWIETYRGRRHGKQVSASTLASYRKAMEKHVLPVLGNHRLAMLEPRHIEALVGDLELTLKPRSLQRTMAPLKLMLGDAERFGRVGRNPMLGVSLPGAPRTPGVRQRGLTIDEQKKLIAAAPEGWRRLSIRTLLASGLRQHELLGLRWRDVGEDRLRVEQAVKADGKIGAPKSEAGRRQVPLASTVLRDLKAWREESVFNGDGDLCFPNAKGGPMSTKNYANRVFAPAVEVAELGWQPTGHNLRHTYAHRALEEGASLETLHRRLGHVDFRTTVNLYGHVQNEVLPEALPEPEWETQGSQKVAMPGDTGRSSDVTAAA